MYMVFIAEVLYLNKEESLNTRKLIFHFNGGFTVKIVTQFSSAILKNNLELKNINIKLYWQISSQQASSRPNNSLSSWSLFLLQRRQISQRKGN